MSAQDELSSKSAPGRQTKLYFLNVGMGEPLYTVKSFADVMHRGQVLSFNVDDGSKPIEIVGGEYSPDGMLVCPAS